jgi:hypothetical protein
MSVRRNFLSAITLLFFLYLSPVFLTFLVPVSAYSIELLNTDILSCDLSGNLKGYYLGIHDNPFGKSYDGGLVLLRLILSGSISQKSWFEFHVLEGGSINPLPEAVGGFVAFSGADRFRVDDLAHVQTRHEDFSSSIAIDRANITMRFPRWDLTVGRQALSLGTTYFWNPIDLLTNFSPYEFDRDYKPGVDAAKADIALGELSGISLMYAAGNHFDFNESALLLRPFATLFDFDLALTTGWFRKDGFAGADFSGEVGPGVGLRGELAYFAAEKDSDFIQVVVGSEYRFANNLYVSGEYFYNGFGTTHTSRYLSKFLSDRIVEGDLYNISRHYLGVLGSYEVTPLLTVALATIINLTDHSVLIDPTVMYSLSDNTECVAGMVLGIGEDPRWPLLKSEFGSYPDYIFVQMKYHF